MRCGGVARAWSRVLLRRREERHWACLCLRVRFYGLCSWVRVGGRGRVYVCITVIGGVMLGVWASFVFFVCGCVALCVSVSAVYVCAYVDVMFLCTCF